MRLYKDNGKNVESTPMGIKGFRVERLRFRV